MAELRERWPSDLNAWTKVPSHPALRRQSEHHSTWRSGPILVVSELALAQLPGRPQGETGPQWHISISASGKRAKPAHIRRALRAFGMTRALEDNHMPGISRAFWLPVDPSLTGVCECKETEVTIVDADGYAWQNPREGDPEGCRGCDYEVRFGKPCPLHHGVSAVPKMVVIKKGTRLGFTEGVESFLHGIDLAGVADFLRKPNEVDDG